MIRGLGFLTNIYAWNGVKDFSRVIDDALSFGFHALELGPAYPLAENSVQQARDAGLVISNLIYCRNLLSSDQGEATEHRKAVEERINFAAATGIDLFVLCGGYAHPCADLRAKDSYATIRTPPAANLEPFLAAYGPLAERAASRGVRLAFENCPLMGNWLISPPLWKAAFEALDAPHVGLAFDPSHLLWQFIDPYRAYADFAERVFHVHAKDTEIHRDRLASGGILSDFSWWESRLPGFGELNWPRFLALLNERGYDGYVSVEHEDPLWSGSLDLVRESLSFTRAYLANCGHSGDLRGASADSARNTARPEGD